MINFNQINTLLNKLLHILLFCTITSMGQNILSFSNDQYSGINGSTFSPTTTYFNPNKWDINLVSEDAFFQNDYAYISDQNVLGLLKGNVKTANPRKGVTGETASNVFDFYKHNHVSYQLDHDIMGPSISFKKMIQNQTFRLGLFTRLRTQGSVKKLDNYMRFSNQKILEPSEYYFDPAKTNFMNWNEFGLNISTNVYTTNTEELVVGANIKYALGLDGAVVKSHQPIKLEADTIGYSSMLHPKANIYASDFNIEASYATNYDFDRDKYVYKNRGNGAGIDLGIAYVKRHLNDELYDFKLSANLLDIGMVKFRGENHRFYNPSKSVQLTNNPNLDDNFESIDQYLKLLSTEVYGD